MSTTVSVPNLEDLLQASLPENQIVASYKQTSVITGKIQTIEVSLENGTTIYIAAKSTVGSKNLFDAEKLQENIQREIIIYNIVAPTLKFFQEQENVDELNFIPVSYGGCNLNSNSILLLEDLTIQGYKNLSSFDLGITRQILKDLASFHAIPVALKLKDPKVFDTKVKRYLTKPFEADTQIIGKIIKMIEEEPDFATYLGKIREKFEDTSCDKTVRAPFSTMIHSECFFKNIMVKTSLDGTADVKFIDFQHCSYGSPAEDLILFLYSSVQTEVLEEHIDVLIEFYHSNFVRVLEECKCDPIPFSIDALLKELKIVAGESAFVRIIINLSSHIFSIKENKKEDKGQRSDVAELVKKKLLFAIKEFVAKKWV